MNDDSKTLPELIAELGAITDQIIENEGVVDDDTDALHDALHDDVEDKIAAYSAVYKEKREQAKALKEVIDHYKSRLKSTEASMEWLKDTAHDALRTLGTDGLDTDVGAVRIQEASRRGIEVHVDAESLPHDLQRVSVHADKRAIRDMMESGDVKRITVDGDAIATMKPATRYVRFY